MAQLHIPEQGPCLWLCDSTSHACRDGARHRSAHWPRARLMSELTKQANRNHDMRPPALPCPIPTSHAAPASHMRSRGPLQHRAERNNATLNTDGQTALNLPDCILLIISGIICMGNCPGRSIHRHLDESCSCETQAIQTDTLRKDRSNAVLQQSLN